MEWQRPLVERERNRVFPRVKEASNHGSSSRSFQNILDEAKQLAKKDNYFGRLEAICLCLEVLKSAAGGQYIRDELMGQFFALGRETLQREGVPVYGSRLSYLYFELDWLRGCGCTLEPNLKSIVDKIKGKGEDALDHGTYFDLLYVMQEADLPKIPNDPLEEQWRLASKRVAELQSLRPFQVLMCRNGSHKPLCWKIRGLLWAYAFKSPIWISKNPKTTSIRRDARRKGVEGECETPWFRLAETMEDCYRTRLSIDGRLMLFRNGLDNLHNAPLEVRLLFYLASARWLLRIKRSSLAIPFMLLYRFSSLQVSKGETDDYLRIGSDLVNLVLDQMNEKKCHPGPIPPTQWRRYREIAALGFHSYRGRKSRMRPELLAASIASRLSRLKGPVMKLGQLASYCSFDLPDNTAQIFGTLRDCAEAVSPDVIQKIVEKELNHPMSELFVDWDETPIAVGSLGQVHRARTKFGRDVTVKVLLPNMKTIIKNDLATLRLSLPLLRRLVPKWDLNGLFEELKTQVLDECDYRVEASRQVKMRALARDTNEIIIPEVFGALSGQYVLTTEYVVGVRFDTFERSASQSKKNQAAEALTRWFWNCVFRWKFFNTDPHPGNFLFLEGKVACLDFGSVKELRLNECNGIKDMMNGLISDDISLYGQGMLKGGFVVSPNQFDAESAFVSAKSSLMGILTASRATPITRDKSKKDVESNFSKFTSNRQVTPELLMIFKAHWGFFATLSLLKVELNWTQIFESIVREQSSGQNSVRY